MKRTFPYRSEVVPGWRGWVCILLIGLVLYNPFAGLFSSNDALCYDGLARNRATVGASELQHFSPVTNSVGQTDLYVDVPATDLIQLVREEYAGAELKQVSPPHSELLNQQWNRPPPSE
ncbi:MAG TPA: hypothetical protein VMJ35_12865 [Dongiaceae bacterium]|nr:hypothetical protein [Dongiaceae bacterium]